jgi:predicted branched-subunit amino acid permease
MAYPLSDETFAFTISHWRRIGYADVPGYFLLGLGMEVAPWVVASAIGAAIAGSIAEPAVCGLDIAFPASMAGLAVGLITGRREFAAAVTGALTGLAFGLLVDPAVGIVAGGVIGPLIGMLVPAGPERLQTDVVPS